MIACACVEFGEEAVNVFWPKSSVPATANTVYLYYPLVAPASHRIAMDMEKPGYFSYCHHRPLITYHIFSRLPFNQSILMIIHSSQPDNHPNVLIGSGKWS